MDTPFVQRVLTFIKQPVGWLSIVALVLVVMCCYTGAVMGGLLPSGTKKQPPPVSMATAPPASDLPATTGPAIPLPPPTSFAPLPGTSPTRNPRCHPNYSVCLRITRDLNCNQIRERDFDVIGGKDPYGLDPDNNGKACERRRD